MFADAKYVDALCLLDYAHLCSDNPPRVGDGTRRCVLTLALHCITVYSHGLCFVPECIQKRAKHTLRVLGRVGQVGRNGQVIASTRPSGSVKGVQSPWKRLRLQYSIFRVLACYAPGEQMQKVLKTVRAPNITGLNPYFGLSRVMTTECRVQSPGSLIIIKGETFVTKPYFRSILSKNTIFKMVKIIGNQLSGKVITAFPTPSTRRARPKVYP